jgi:hypothetical protein
MQRPKVKETRRHGQPRTPLRRIGERRRYRIAFVNSEDRDTLGFIYPA